MFVKTGKIAYVFEKLSVRLLITDKYKNFIAMRIKRIRKENQKIFILTRDQD